MRKTSQPESLSEFELIRIKRLLDTFCRDRWIVCLAHITNSMATKEDDFEKGGDLGTHQALAVCAVALTAALEHAGGSHEGS